MWNHPPRKASSVALRPEPFGALVYHFGNRKLSFLKSKTLVSVVEALGDHPSAAAALTACGVTDAQRPVEVVLLGAVESGAGAEPGVGCQQARRMRQGEHRREAGERDDDRRHGSEDRPVDEEAGEQGRPR